MNSETRRCYINGRERNQEFYFCSNYISTTKYSMLSFLPVSLFEQFKRAANIYFLIIAVLQSIPSISPLHPFSAIAPLIFVLAVSMTRAGVEDFLRYRADLEANSALALVYRGGGFTETTFKDVQVGDLVLVMKDKPFPCDLVLLSCEAENGISYVETSMLDGEKALKPRMPISETNHLYKDGKPITTTYLLEYELPNPRLYNFNGKISVDSLEVSVDKANVFLAGAVLRNTKWALGAAVYTGSDTKMRQNMSARTFKQSQVERRVNHFILSIILLQLVMCLFCGVNGGIWANEEMAKHSYLQEEDPNEYVQGILNYFTYFILLNTMIPISLIISLEIVKVGQAMFMHYDREMYCELRDRPCKISSFTLNEELGMIQHVFTDKTGTLTCNQMKFKSCTIAMKDYGEQPKDAEEATELNSQDILSELTDPASSAVSASDIIATQGEYNEQFLQCMSLCHDCILDSADGQQTYTGQSPDEVTIVETACEIGYQFNGCTNNTITVQVKHRAEQQSFDKLCAFEFSSERKRSSIVVKNCQDNRIYLYIKGADIVMNSLLSHSSSKEVVENIRKGVHEYSMKGFRTLMFGYRIIPESIFSSWKARYNTASTLIEDREAAMDRLASEIEVDITLLGCTAVEDALQPDVPHTLRQIHLAGINIWMLTGDKLETAENIGRNCQMISEEMVVERCRGGTLEQTYSSLVRIQSAFDENYKVNVFGLIIEGSAIEMILHNKTEPKLCSDAQRHLEALARKVFLELARACKTVICCRMTPGQKRDIVKMVKEELGLVTLAIGDGGNDVSMIMEAHIGIGLYGEEGMQSVQASDYAVGEFRYLWDLLFVHGRFNYMRQSEMIMYFFYKNLIFTVPQFYFAFFTVFSGQTVYDDWYITFYNMVFTAFPLLVRGIFDGDMIVPSREQAKNSTLLNKVRKLVPLTYADGRKNVLFTWSRFGMWLLNGYFHAAIVFFVALYASVEGVLDDSGHSHDLWSFSITSFTAVILIVNLKLMLVNRLWNFLHFIAIIVFSIGLFFGFIFAYDSLASTNSSLTVSTLAGSYYFYVTIYCCVTLVFAIDGGFHLYKKISNPTLSEQLYQMATGGKANHALNLTQINKDCSHLLDLEDLNSPKC